MGEEHKAYRQVSSSVLLGRALGVPTAGCPRSSNAQGRNRNGPVRDCVSQRVRFSDSGLRRQLVFGTSATTKVCFHARAWGFKHSNASLVTEVANRFFQGFGAVFRRNWPKAYVLAHFWCGATAVTQKSVFVPALWVLSIPTQVWSQKLQIVSPKASERFPRELAHRLRFSTFAGIVLFLGFGAVCRGYCPISWVWRFVVGIPLPVWGSSPRVLSYFSGLGRCAACIPIRIWGGSPRVLPPHPRFFGPFPSKAGRVTFKEKGFLTVFEGFRPMHCVSSVFCGKMQPCSLKVFKGFGLRVPPCVGRCAAQTFQWV